MEYGYGKETNLSFADAVARVKEALAAEGFGVLTEIDVKKTMKEKIGADYDDYVILGACNPAFADRALRAEREVGLLLPCNVIVYQDGGAVRVSAIIPSAAMGMVDNPALADLAREVESRLRAAIEAV